MLLPSAFPVFAYNPAPLLAIEHSSKFHEDKLRQLFPPPSSLCDWFTLIEFSLVFPRFISLIFSSSLIPPLTYGYVGHRALLSQLFRCSMTFVSPSGPSCFFQARQPFFFITFALLLELCTLWTL